MKNKLFMSVFVFAALALLGVGMVSAFQGGSGKGQGMMGENFEGLSESEQADILAFRESVFESVENNDFDSWKSLMESRLTQENFNRMVERHGKMSELQGLHDEMNEAWENEDYEKIQELRENLPEDFGQKRERMEERHSSQGEGFQKGGFFNKFRFW